jgi:hypothetical protein
LAIFTLTWASRPSSASRARGHREVVVQFDAGHLAREAAHARGHPAGAGPDLQHAVAGLQCQRLQRATFDHGLEHLFPVPDRQRQVGVGQRPVRVRHEDVARERREHVEHAHVQYVPGAHLLLDHQFAGAGVIDRSHLWTSLAAAGRNAGPAILPGGGRDDADRMTLVAQ